MSAVLVEGLTRRQRRELREIEVDLGADLGRRLHETAAARLRAVLAAVPVAPAVVLLALSVAALLVEAGAGRHPAWTIGVCALVWAPTVLLLLGLTAERVLQTVWDHRHRGPARDTTRSAQDS
ncbi:hypothetical protein C7C46_03535 [Streptomyces tateyamensis]|uniref:DUF3040 domain-containing protein n=1 Tax=Streptomyces tateyamensis TaxID=565073 RepID=A0A2V4NPR1_9ACTN|nr:hypothetical protein [Streptomyces tateyamensis]PYC87608.1 hypothetical protein C7C46_03535 [Streptomyces tateyamensis]